MTPTTPPHGRSSMPDPADPAEGLSCTLATALGRPVAVTSLRPLSGGASRRSWAVEIDEAEQRRRLVLQLAAGGGSGIGSIRVEAAVLRAAGHAGVPVPAVVAAGEDGPLEAPFLITEWVDGETLPSRIFGDPRYTEAVAHLHDDCATALAAIHSLPADRLALATTDPIEPYRQNLDDSGQAHPVLEWAYRWLTRHRPPADPTVVLHGDFRLGNLMIRPAGLGAVLDWELVHLGDYYEDLAWPLVRAWRFDKVRPIGGFPERATWMDAYGRASGREVDPEVLRWWEVAATFKWGVICITQWIRHRDGDSRSVELAAVGRRVAENEYDLLQLIP